MCKLYLVRVGLRVVSLRHIILFEETAALPPSPSWVAARLVLETGISLDLGESDAGTLRAAIDAAIEEQSAAGPVAFGDAVVDAPRDVPTTPPGAARIRQAE